ncbi:phosphohydrolase [Rhodanobacter sp. B2A1Ga4]|jgi:Guanosine polyphosphate pyrophosphohydrolases/synthetases|uniref:phosphohydrolase n=1 Tax=Rhodanobacter sp. B2A1Ga4 TaxID=2778647 RepID=UPI001B36BB54|nr:phosphohydrolase [Rhodanobacter sp. B2A1Ga4]MBQ4855774.1 phosphohydrolase [Rhodanobacter sp. B2A1Ga4]
MVNIIDANTVSRAKALALKAHAHQVDKAGRPYTDHVARVAAAVAGNYRAEAVAWLHDVLEDCPAYASEVNTFPVAIVDAVRLLTRTRSTPTETYYDRIRTSPVALAVKRADLDDNADPDRLALLPEHIATRLSAKYQHARRALELDAS